MEFCFMGFRESRLCACNQMTNDYCFQSYAHSMFYIWSISLSARVVYGQNWSNRLTKTGEGFSRNNLRIHQAEKHTAVSSVHRHGEQVRRLRSRHGNPIGTGSRADGIGLYGEMPAVMSQRPGGLNLTIGHLPVTARALRAQRQGFEGSPRSFTFTCFTNISVPPLSWPNRKA